MKKLLLLLVLFSGSGLFNYSSSQCVISDLSVRLISVNYTTCEYTFDFSWTQEVNLGNKFAYVHMWSQSGYHTPAANWVGMYKGTSDYPKAADLVNAVSTIVIDSNSKDIPVIGTEYHPDPTYVLPQLTGLSIVKVHLNNTLIERMTVQNIKLILPNCVGAQTILFDIWASQAANGKNVHCASQGARLVVNEIRPVGLLECSLPRRFQVFIQNNGPALDNVQYDVHLDYAPFGVLNPTDTVVFVSTPITLPANGTYTSPLTGYLPYSERNPSVGLPLIIEVTVPDRPNTTTARIENGCGTLPVTLTFFTAQQQKDKILLNWQTAKEQNCRGFEIQRSSSAGDYRAIAFVNSKALTGNSEVLLDYGYTDMDNLQGAGIVYYRIKQVDLDGKSIFSEVRPVKINIKAGDISVIPNPAAGFAKVILPAGSGPADIMLHDNTGKTIKSWNGVVDQLQLDNLVKGIYILRVFIKQTGEIKVKKIIML